MIQLYVKQNYQMSDVLNSRPKKSGFCYYGKEQFNQIVFIYIVYLWRFAFVIFTIISVGDLVLIAVNKVSMKNFNSRWN